MTRSSKTVIDLTGDSDDSAPARRSNRSNRLVPVQVHYYAFDIDVLSSTGMQHD